MKSLFLILSLSLVSPLHGGWWLSDEDSRKYQIPQVKQQDIKVKEQTLSQMQYQATFGDYNKRAAIKAHFDKIRRESPDFVLFAPVKAEQPKQLTAVNVAPQVNIAPQAIKPQEVKAVPVAKFEPQGIVKAVVSAIKAVVVEIRNAVNYAAGQVFGILSGDIFKRQETIRFDPAPGKPAVISINGILNTRKQGDMMAETVRNAFGVSHVGIVRNDTGFLRLISDTLQLLGHEVLGAMDKPVKSATAAMKQGIQEKGSVFVVAHSQGTAIFALALRGLTKEERSRVHYYGAGSQWFMNANRAGLASARNVRNAGDPVPALGNTWNVSNFVNPTHFSRVGGDWEKIEVKTIGSRHSFERNYADDMSQWAKEMAGD